MPLKVIIEEMKKLNETLEKANKDVDDMRKKANEDFNRLIENSEQLKHYQLGDCMNDCEHYDNCSNYIYSKGYNKAIDDFAERIIEVYSYLPASIVKELAEQLKSRTEC